MTRKDAMTASFGQRVFDCLDQPRRGSARWMLLASIMMLAAVAPPAAAATTGQASFSAASDLPVDVGPVSVAVGDFNGDGSPDLVTTNLSAGTVSVLLGNGAGGFSAATNLAAGASPWSVAVGDLNGDGKPDLAVATADGVAVLLNDGTGGFSASTVYDTGGTSPTAVAIGDFNGDGKQDLAVVNSGTNDVSILLGDGTGNFAAASIAATTFPVGAGAFSLAVGDFNGDGKLDLAVGNESANTVSILLGDGSGGFSPAVDYAAGTSPGSVAVGDFNGDGKQDLAVADVGSGGVSVLLGDGTGRLSSPTATTTGASPYSVAVGDFNRDGKQDLVVANSGGTAASVLLGNGAGGLSAATNYTTGAAPRGVAVGDFNKDGKPDLAIADSNSNSVSVLLNNTPPPPPTITGPANGSYNNTRTVLLSGTAQANSTVTLYDGASSQGTAPASASGAWTKTLTAVADGTHTYTATATDAGHDTGVASTPLQVIEDTQAPAAPTITSPTNGSYNNTRTVVLSGTAEANSTVTLYDGASSQGTAPASASGAWTKTLAAVADGTHTYTATATDAAHNTGVASTPVHVIEDGVAPQTAITSGPSGMTNSPSFSFSSSKAGATFTCRLAGPGQAGGYAACSSPMVYPNLPDGSYTFSVRATDAAGNTDPNPPSRTFSVQTRSSRGAGASSAGGGERSNATRAPGGLSTTSGSADHNGVRPTGAALIELALSPSAFVAAPWGPSASDAGAGAGAKTGTTIAFSLTQPGIVRFAIELRVAGHTAQGRCVTGRRHRANAACKRFRALSGSFVRAAATGANHFHFSGRLAGHKLTRGRYRLVATTSSGQSFSTPFRIK
jgi:large repetitive protein